MTALTEPPPLPPAPPAPAPVAPPPAPPPPDSVRGQLMDKLDKHLDQDEEDKKTMDRLKNPFVRWIVGSLVFLLFLVFGTYFASFVLKVPLPESKILEHLMNVIVEIMKILVPPT